MSDMVDLLDYWSANPPMHVIEAARLSAARRKNNRSKVVDVESLPPKERKPKPPRELNQEELAAEAKLPAHVRELRAQKRAARLQECQATSTSGSLQMPPK